MNISNCLAIPIDLKSVVNYKFAKRDLVCTSAYVSRPLILFAFSAKSAIDTLKWMKF